MNRPAAPAAAEIRASPLLGAFEGFGIELEYMLVERDGLDVAPRAAEVLRAAAGSAQAVSAFAHGEFGWSNELTAHVLELKNLRPAAFVELAPAFQREIGELAGLLQRLGLSLMPGGMHPWMEPQRETQLWPHDAAAVYQRFDRLFDCRRHGWANIQSTHLNLPFADDREFERLHAAVRLVLPILPALAASSPFAEGRFTGRCDYRMEVYRHNSASIPQITGRVVPENVRTRAEYEARILSPMYAALAPLDPEGLLRQEWLNSRGAIARFSRNAIEIRVLDVQECVEADLGLSALATELARALYEEKFSRLRSQQALSEAALEAILVDCLGEAECAHVRNPQYLRVLGLGERPLQARALWHEVGEALDRRGAHYGTLWKPTLHRLLAHGSLATRLLKAAGRNPGRADLAACYAELCRCLASGLPFLP